MTTWETVAGPVYVYPAAGQRIDTGRTWQEGTSGHRERCSFMEEALLQASSSTVAEEAKVGSLGNGPADCTSRTRTNVGGYPVYPTKTVLLWDSPHSPYSPHRR